MPSEKAEISCEASLIQINNEPFIENSRILQLS